MSGRSDLRMYVEHLFEGRTLDAETIELKEEIYGNLVALMSTVDGLDAVRIVETEPDDGHSDTDVHIFDRSVVEGVLGLPLNAELLTEDTWNATRDTVMMERYWDPIWESADAD